MSADGQAPDSKRVKIAGQTRATRVRLWIEKQHRPFTDYAAMAQLGMRLPEVQLAFLHEEREGRISKEYTLYKPKNGVPRACYVYRRTTTTT